MEIEKKKYWLLLYGLITGILFGFLLQKGRVLRYNRQIGAMLLVDMTIVKFMLSTIVVGMIGVHLLNDLGQVSLNLKPTNLGANIIGGLIFGIGWGLLGYCPGTSLGAVGEGRWDAAWGILGMLVGAGLFAEAYGGLQKTVLTWGTYGKITLPQILGVNHWLMIAAFTIAAGGLFAWLESKDL